MPMEKIDYGTNADWSESKTYCYQSFQEGRFTIPGITVGQMIVRVSDILEQEKGLSETQAINIARMLIPKLKRWRNI